MITYSMEIITPVGLEDSADRYTRISFFLLVLFAWFLLLCNPCVEWAKPGSHKREKGKTMVLYFIWKAHRFQLQESRIFNECVTQMPTKMLDRDLSPMYVPIHLILEGHPFGTECNRLRKWSYFICKNDIVMKVSNQFHLHPLNIATFMQKNVFRRADYSIKDFYIDEEKDPQILVEYQEEHTKAISRRSVQMRAAKFESFDEVVEIHPYFDGYEGAFGLDTLNCWEVMNFNQAFDDLMSQGGAFMDLMQNYAKRKGYHTDTKNQRMHTIIKNCGRWAHHEFIKINKYLL